MFYNCNSLKSINLSNFNTSSVTNMEYMFNNCNSLKSINLSNFNTSSVTNMRYMFENCNSLKSINLSNFNTSSVTFMNSMFYLCNSLESIDLSNFNTSSVTNIQYMFNGCASLAYIKLYGITEGSNKLSGTYLNLINNLIVCQDKLILNKANMKSICCDFNIEIGVCQSNNYLKLYYMLNVTYPEGFKSPYRNNITFINYKNTTMTDNNELIIQADSEVEIHFGFHIDDLQMFFSKEIDNNMENLKSIDFTHFDSSMVTNMNSIFYGCSSLELINL